MKKFFLILLLICVLGVGVVIWQRSRLPAWIALKIKTTVNEEFLKGTAAELKDLQFEADLWSFLFGQDGRLQFQLNFGDMVLRGNGPVKIHIAREKIQFQYTPEIGLRSLKTDQPLVEPVVKVFIAGEIPTAKPAASTLNFRIEPHDLSAPGFSVKGDIGGSANFTTHEAQGKFLGKKISFRTATNDLVECSDFQTQFLLSTLLMTAEVQCREILAQTADESTMLLLKQQRVQVELDSAMNHGDVKVMFGDVESLVGPVLLQTGHFKSDVLSLQFEVTQSTAPEPSTAAAVLVWGPLKAKVRGHLSGDRPLQISWTLKPLNLNPVLDAVMDEFFKKQIRLSGARAQGSGNWTLSPKMNLQGVMREVLRNVGFKISFDIQNQKAQWRAMGVGIDVKSEPHSLGTNAELSQDGVGVGLDLNVDEFAWRGLGGRLYPSNFQMRIVPAANLNQLRGSAIGQAKVAIKEIDANIQPVKATLLAATSQESFLERLQIETAVSASTESVASVFEKVCLPWPKQWKTSFDLDWKKVTLKNGNLKLDGETKISVIGGTIVTGPIVVKDVLSPARLTRFSTLIRGLQLKELGEPLNFGEMDGTLKGDLLNVEMLGFVPRRYFARFELVPHQKSVVVFSAIAMKNFVSLFTPEDFSGSLPGPIREVAFGWFSRLLGGYNIQYAGLSLSAVDDSILLETLDPEDRVKSGGQRYLLYGTRFKIPLKSARYPVVLDAPGLTNFVLHIQSVLSELSKKAKPENSTDVKTTKGDEDVSKDYCNPDAGNSQ